MSSKMYLIIMIIGCLIFYAITIPIYAKKKKKQKEYMQENPDVVKVYLKPAMDQNITVRMIDGEKPELFNEGLKWGFLTKAGKREIEMTSRVSEKTSMIMMKETTETIYGPDTIEFNFVAGNKYQLTFDSEINAYTITAL